MVQTTCHVPDTFRLTHAVLLYRGSHSVEYSSIHAVEHTDRGMVIGAGHPASKTALIGLLEDLKPKKKKAAASIEVFAPNLLSKGAGHLVWYCKPQLRQVWFNCTEFDGKVSAVVPHPGLVFSVSSKGWQVFAVKGDQRPEAETEIFVAPYFNVWAGGGICAGNVDVPKREMKWNSAAWEEAFFRSYFTHINIREKNKLVKFGKGPYAFWRNMLAGKYRKFPEQYLVTTGKSLAETLNGTLKKGGR